MNDQIYIVIATYNGMTWLPETMVRIPKTAKVIVVDNASQDDSAGFIEKNYPSAVMLRQTKNLGFGQANNIGISHALQAGGRFIFLLNQDAYLEPGCLETLRDVSCRHPEYGVLSPLHWSGDGGTLDHLFARYVSPERNRSLLSDALSRTLRDVYEFPFINAAAWLLTAQAVRKAGMFDPIFFHYGEDENYCQRLRYHGLKIGVVPAAAVRHDRPQTSRDRPKIFSSTYFQWTERRLKINFADINRPLTLRSFLLWVVKTVGKDLILDLRDVRDSSDGGRLHRYLLAPLRVARQTIRMMRACWPEIKASRATNLARRAG